MWKHLRSAVCGSLLCAGLAVTPSTASENRSFSFIVPCNGQQQTINLTASGLGTASTRFVQGAELALFQKDPSTTLQYIVLAATGGSGSTLAMLGVSDTHVGNMFTGFYALPNNSGTIPFTLFGSCTGGGQVQGFVVVQFFS